MPGENFGEDLVDMTPPVDERTLVALRKKTGLPRSTLTKILTGQSGVIPRWAEQLNKAYGTDYRADQFNRLYRR